MLAKARTTAFAPVVAPTDSRFLVDHESLGPPLTLLALVRLVSTR
jgi:hypothetical protein